MQIWNINFFGINEFFFLSIYFNIIINTWCNKKRNFACASDRLLKFFCKDCTEFNFCFNAFSSASFTQRWFSTAVKLQTTWKRAVPLFLAFALVSRLPATLTRFSFAWLLPVPSTSPLCVCCRSFWFSSTTCRFISAVLLCWSLWWWPWTSWPRFKTTWCRSSTSLCSRRQTSRVAVVVKVPQWPLPSGHWLARIS